ncbi:hypothetical protein MKW98_026916 [Papaver atlanticum]|uniref:F-box domain-containing protein n=1 Tax=Papaver atlanticum TaxID=357466 RepID=A0AAD4SUQ9_9MAGN|nr:hypothetical protein MKW98_026916 [Papaver atlanticum]
MGSRLMEKNINKIFPTEILSDILNRLPTESVLECKLVCKIWKNLIQHSSFPQMHLARLNHPDSIDSEVGFFSVYFCFGRPRSQNRYASEHS